jgi:hypothetical protein
MGPAEIEIRSSLEGLEVLPPRIEWTVTTSLPPERVKEVRFWVDSGPPALWRDREPPFAYGEDGAQLGTWMGSGEHRFTVLAVATDGSRATETVVANVKAPKTDKRLIEQGFWGRYQRLSPADVRTPPAPRTEPDFVAADARGRLAGVRDLVPTALDNGQRSPRNPLAAVVRRLVLALKRT